LTQAARQAVSLSRQFLRQPGFVHAASHVARVARQALPHVRAVA